MRRWLRAARVVAWEPRPDPTSAIGAFFAGVNPNAIEVRDHRIAFTISKSLKSEPNPAEITLTNLSRETIGFLQRRPLRLALEVGYGRDLAQIFVGDVTYAPPTVDGVDTHVRLLVSDGGRAYRWAEVNRSLTAGTQVLAAIRDTAAAMGLELPAAVAARPELQQRIPTGLVLVGRASRQLTLLLEPYGLGWSVQDGTLQVLGAADVRPGSVLVIDEASGMIGSPSLTPPSRKGEKPRLSVTMSLAADIGPGRKIEVRSRHVAGQFRVEETTHEGDTGTADGWTTTLEATPL